MWVRVRKLINFEKSQIMAFNVLFKKRLWIIQLLCLRGSKKKDMSEQNHLSAKTQYKIIFEYFHLFESTLVDKIELREIILRNSSLLTSIQFYGSNHSYHCIKRDAISTSRIRALFIGSWSLKYASSRENFPNAVRLKRQSDRLILCTRLQKDR